MNEIIEKIKNWNGASRLKFETPGRLATLFPYIHVFKKRGKKYSWLYFHGASESASGTYTVRKEIKSDVSKLDLIKKVERFIVNNGGVL
jgi:hypothetical protein